MFEIMMSVRNGFIYYRSTAPLGLKHLYAHSDIDEFFIIGFMQFKTYYHGYIYI